MVRVHTVVCVLTSATACGSGAGVPPTSPRPLPPPPTVVASAQDAPPPSPPQPPRTVELIPVDAPVADAPDPPQLTCDPGAAAERTHAPDPTWACVRPSGVRHGPFVALFPDGSPEISGAYKDGALDGPWQRHRPDGSLAETGNYVAGQKSGHWQMLAPTGAVLGEYDMKAGTGTEKWWLDDGTLYRERTLRAGVPSGPDRTYGPDGVPVATAQWIAGKLDGARAIGTRNTLRIDETYQRGVRYGSRQIWLFTSLLLDEAYDQHGKRDGEYAIWRNKKVMRVHGQYDHGKRDGLWTWSDRDGNKEREGNYIEGKREGPWTEWADNSIVFTGGYVDGKPDGTFIYYDRQQNELGRFDIKAGTGTLLTFWPNKQVASRQHVSQGLADGVYQELTNRGKVVVEGHYRGDAKHGMWKEWTPEGILTLEQTWKRGKLDGAIRKYADGKLVSEATYKEGKATGNYIEYRAGKPAVTGQFTADRKTGVWTQYDADGHVALTMTYKDGVLDGPWRQLSGGAVLEGTLTQGRRTGTWTETNRAGDVRQFTYPTGPSAAALSSGAR